MYTTRTRKVKTDRRDARALGDAYRRAHRRGAVTAVPRLALPGLTARRQGDPVAHRGSMIAAGRTTSFSKHSLKQMRD